MDKERAPLKGSQDQQEVLAQGHELERIHPKTWRCNICGQSWMNRHRRDIASLGRCPGTFMWDQQPNLPEGPRVAPRGSQIIVNGRVLHPSHNLAWHRGLYFCWRCGYLGTQNRIGRPLTAQCVGDRNPNRERNLQCIRAGTSPLKSGEWPLGPRDPVPPPHRSLSEG